MNSMFRGILLPLVALATVLPLGSCSESEQTKSPKPAALPPADKVWTSEEVAKDPTGYMNWADSRVAKQIEDRQRRIRTLSDKLASIEGRQQTMQQNLLDTANILNRMEMAIRRAEDEDRWPIQMAGRKFTKAEALSMVEQARKYAEDRKPLAGAYEQAVGRVRNMLGVLNREIGELNRLREKMELDLEAVKLTQGLEDLEKLRKTEADISGYAKALGSMADDSLMETLPDEQGMDNAKVDMDSFMKK